jgi:hypothetical protein
MQPPGSSTRRKCRARIGLQCGSWEVSLKEREFVERDVRCLGGRAVELVVCGLLEWRGGMMSPARKLCGVWKGCREKSLEMRTTHRRHTDDNCRLDFESARCDRVGAHQSKDGRHIRWARIGDGRIWKRVSSRMVQPRQACTLRLTRFIDCVRARRSRRKRE